MYINVDLKDAPESYEGSIAPQIMFDTIAENQAFDRVLVTSFIKNKSSVLIKLHKDPLQLVLANRKLQRHFKISFIRWQVLPTISTNVPNAYSF